MKRLLLTCFLTLLLLVSNSNASINDEDDDDNELVGTKPNPWVSAAPLVIAAVCSDGVALVALHGGNTTANNETDWLEKNREVSRIHTIDADGTALLCAGWRPDAEWLASKCRLVVARHVATFGPSSSSASDYLPQDASLWMASCARNKRPLSVVALLASSSKQLSLVDATGHYAVRAHAVGRGARRVNAQILRRIDFSECTAKEGVQCILEELVKLSAAQEGDENKDEPKDDWVPLSNMTRVELAVVAESTSITATMKKLQRIRQPFLAVVPRKQSAAL